MEGRRRPILYVALAFAGLIALGFGLRPRADHATPEPTDAELEAFLRLVPRSFESLIAAREAETAVKTRTVPIAIGLPDGATVRIMAPVETPNLDSKSDLGTRAPDGTYEPPRVRRGSAIDRFNARRGDERRVLRLVVMGTAGRRSRVIDDQPGVVLSSGVSTKRDLGPMIPENGRIRVPAEGASNPGFVLLSQAGVPPRRIQLAPEGLDPSTPSKPGGYALLYDEMTLARTVDPNSRESSTLMIGPLLPPPFQRLWTRTATVTSYSERFIVTGLVHVYRHQEGGWRYSRSWSLIGEARTTFASDEALFARARRLDGRGPVTFGVPKILVPLAASPLVP